jgi:enoyl-CoA hydratase/carnithine racemase
MIGQRRRCRLLSGISLMTRHLTVSQEDATRVIKLRRPEKNAFSQDIHRGMNDVINRAQNNPDIRCIKKG